MKDKIKVSEIFGPTHQGEGKYVGTPSIFIRTFGCNFRCKSFGMPLGKESLEADAIMAQHKEKPFSTLKDMPLVTTGCDTYFSIYPKLKDISKDMYPVDIVNKVLELEYHKDNRSHIVITGGEPLLGWQKHYAYLLETLQRFGYEHITFETNGTQTINKEFGE